MSYPTPKSQSTSPESPHSTSFFNIYNSTLNQEGLRNTQVNNPAKAFKILMGIQETQADKYPDLSCEASGDLFVELVQ